MYSKTTARIIVALATGVLLASCQASGKPQSPDPRPVIYRPHASLVSQTNDYKRTVVEGAQAGALIGAIGAATATALSGSKGRHIARNTAIGAVIGGVIGTAVGQKVAEDKQRYAAREDALGAAIRHAEANNAKLSAMVSTANALVRERRDQAAAIDRLAADQKRDLHAAIAGDRRTLSEAIGATEDEISQLQSLRNRFSNSSSLDAQIRETREKQAQLSQSNATLTDIQETLE